MIKVTSTGIPEAQHLFDALNARLADLSPAMEVVGMNLQRRVARRFQSGSDWPQSIRAQREGGRTMLLSNRLRNSIGTLGDEGVFDVTKMSVTLGTNTVYARLMQEGGIVRPKTAKFLAIPVNRKARRASATVATIRDIPNLVWLPSKAGDTGGVLGKKIGGDIEKYKGDVRAVRHGEGKRAGTGKSVKGFFEPWFVLKKSVTIPARPFLYIEDGDIPMIERVIRRYIATEPQEGEA